MATDLGYAYVSIIPSTGGMATKIKQEINGIKGNIPIHADTKSAESGLSRVKDIMKSIIGIDIGKKLADGMVSFGKAAINSATQGENFDIVLTNLTGSADEANSLLQDMSKLAIESPFDLQSVLVGTKRLIAYGFSADEAKKSLTAIGDAAAGLGTGSVGIERITTALGQMHQKGTVQAEEMRQLAEAGIPAWQYLADTMGVTVAEAMDKVKDRSVSAKTGVDAIINGMENGTKNARGFAGQMEAQSKTLLGVLSNIQDIFEITMMKLKDTSGYKALTAALYDVYQNVEPLVMQLFPAFSAGLEVAAGVVGGFGKVMDFLTGVMKDMGGWINQLGDSLQPIINNAMPGFQDAASTAFQTVHDWIQNVVNFLSDKFFPKIQELQDKFGPQFSTAIGGAFDFIKGEVEKIGQAISDNFGPVVDFIVGTFIPTVMGIASAFIQISVTVLESIAGIVGAFINAQANGESLKQTISDVFNAAKDGGSSIVDTIDNVIPGFGTAWQGAVDTATGVIDFFKQHLSEIAAFLAVPVTVTFFDGISTALSGLDGPINSFFGKIAEFGASGFPGFEALKGALSSVSPFFQNIVNDANNLPGVLSNVMQVIENNGGGLSGTLSTIGQSISLTFAGVPSIFEAAGGGLSGFVAVLSSMFSPFTLVVGAIAALAGGFTYLYTTSQPFRDMINSTIGVMMDQLAPTIATIVGQLTTTGQSLMTILGPALQTIFTVLGQIAGIIVQVAAIVIPIIANIVATILPYLSMIVEAIATVISTIITVVGGIISFILGVISTILGAIQGFMALIQTVIMTPINILLSFVTGVFSGLTSLVGGALEAIVGFFSNGLGKANEIVTSILGKIKDFFSGIFQSLANAADTGFKAILDATHFIADIPGKVADFIGQIPKVFTDIIDKALGWGKDLIDGFLDGLKSAWDGVTGFFGGAVDWIKGILHFSRPDFGPLRDLYKWPIDMMHVYAQGIEIGTPEVKSAINGVGAEVKLGLKPYSGVGGYDNTYSSGNGNVININANVQSIEDPYVSSTIVARTAAGILRGM